MNNISKSGLPTQTVPRTALGPEQHAFVTASPRHSIGGDASSHRPALTRATRVGFESEPSDEWRDDYGRGGPVRSNEPERDWFFEHNVTGGRERVPAERSTKRAKQEGSLRGKGPKGYRPRDDRVQELVCERLTEDPELDASELSITVECGIVKVSGAIQSTRMRDRVLSDIRDVHGVIGVVDDVHLAPRHS